MTKKMLQKKAIQTLTKENKLLRDRGESLYQELQLEKSKPRQGYDMAKQLIQELREKIASHDRAITELNQAVSAYEDAARQLMKLKASYEKQQQKTMRILRPIVR